jgi:predicted ATP-grasp superfamily ATP-dependent carboligase
MAAKDHLLIIGASARAAAFSALRSQLRPWCGDLFADMDLKARCPTRIVHPANDPEAFLQLARQAPPGPWMFTGGLENRPELIAAIARHRPLWGNGPDVLSVARSPFQVANLVQQAGLPSPRVLPGNGNFPRKGNWLVKPLAGAGGAGIRRWSNSTTARPSPRRRAFFQEFIAGQAFASVYLGDGTSARLLGSTQQLVGESWLHAGPFRYCGSIGPIDFPAPLIAALQQIGQALTSGSGLRGLFGVDWMWKGEAPWLIEVNPRYTASVEVLEYSQGLPALALHRGVFEAGTSAPVPRMRDTGVVGKAILFARKSLHFPEDGPWAQVLRRPGPVQELPPFADIPGAGQQITARRPILTFFARASMPATCVENLKAIAWDLDHRLFGR